MIRELRACIGLFIFLSLLTGVAYPFFMTFSGQLFFPHRANGSLIKEGDIIIGSELIGQKFFSDKYFHSRPSAAGSGYDAAASLGSNLAPTSKKLIGDITDRVQDLRKTTGEQPIPVDLVTSSSSGLDPDISVAAAQFQKSRIAKARNLSLQQVDELISLYTTHRTFGFLGESRVNVLAINRALDLLLPLPDLPRAAP